MSDLIDRRAAIDAADRADYTGLAVEDVKKVTDEVVKELKQLPSAQPERKKGEWKETDDGWDGTYYVCSECGCSWDLIDGTPEDNGMNFCPNCGADMRGDADE